MEFRDLKKQYAILKKDIDNVIENVCNEAKFISGSQVTELENQLADYVGVKHCITCANGTDALSLALMCWEIKEGDAVFVPDFTFFASGECPAFEGATPIFVDVCENTFNIDPIDLEKKIEFVLQETDLKPKVIIPVDLFGLPYDYFAIKRIADKYNLLILEDGAQGFGGSISVNRKKYMACSLGDISTTSFFPAKPLGCYGDGGAIFTNNDEWCELIKSYAVHGKGSMKYDNVRLGINSRLDTIQAAILLVKLKAFKEYELNDVNDIANRYNEYFDGNINKGISLPFIPQNYYSSFAQFTLKLNMNVDRKEIQNKLKNKGIPTMVYYPIPMHKQVAFKDLVFEKCECKIADSLCDKVLSIPIGPYMSIDDCKIVCDELMKLV